jgi:hypothetical protein
MEQSPMPCSRLALLAAISLLSGTTAASAQAPPTQLDRIEQKLDTILHRLDESRPGPLAPSQSASPAAESDRLAAPPASGTATSALVSTPDVLAAGALAIIHAAPTTAVAAREIPADSVGGFVYTGGSLQLADLKDHGVRYTGLTGVEWQGWLRAKETGRYELDLDGNSVSPNTSNTATCLFTGWLEDRSIGLQQATANAGPAEAAPFSLILGAELQPGLYKLRLWATCSAQWLPRLRVSVALFEKTPADLNLRPVTADDLAHRQR